MVEVVWLRCQEDASTSDDKEAEHSGERERAYAYMWQGRDNSRSIITGKDGRHEEATKGPNKILPRSARH